MIEAHHLPHEAEGNAVDRAPKIDEHIDDFCRRIGAESHGDTRIITDGHRLVQVKMPQDESGVRLVWRKDPTAVLL